MLSSWFDILQFDNQSETCEWPVRIAPGSYPDSGLEFRNMKGKSMADQSDMRPFRQGVGIMLLNGEGKIFVGARANSSDGYWQMPQGGVDEGEPLREAALRELLEEIGTRKAEIIAEHDAWISYEFPEEVSRKTRDGRYRGQSHRWFVMRFTGEDADIDIAVATPEFKEWKWEDIDWLSEHVVPFKQESYRQVVEAFRQFAQPA